jgi:hypothetical protein
MNNNNRLTEEKQFKESAPIIQQQPHSKNPDDLSGLHIEAKFKISDPESGEVIIEGRA